MAGQEPQIDGIVDLAPIGSGGFSTVFVGIDTAFNRRVAIKVLRDLDADGHRRFDRERGLMGALDDHPGVVTPYRYGYTASQVPYLVMEYLPGGSLQDLIDDGGPLPWPRAVSLLVPMARVLGDAHRRGVLHKDVKPANILLTSGGEPKLADFGVATLRGSSTTMVSFTLAHAPPETFSDGTDRRDERSDLYSLGSTLHALVTGRAPFEVDGDDAPLAHLRRIENDRPEPTGLDDGLDRLLVRVLAKDPAERPASGHDLADRLEALLGSDSPGREGTAATRPAAPTPVTVPAPPPHQVGGRGPRIPVGPASSWTAPAPERDGRQRRPSRPLVVGSLVVVAVALSALVASSLADGGDSTGASAGPEVTVTIGGDTVTAEPTGADSAAADPGEARLDEPGGDAGTEPSTSTATSPSTGSTTVPDPPCTLTGMAMVCASSDPEAVITATNVTDTSGCVLTWDILWGDGTTENRDVDAGPVGPSGSASHVYATPGTYSIFSTIRATSGTCLTHGHYYEFTWTG